MPSRTIAAVSAFFCLLGIGISIELTRIHWFVYTDLDYHSVCAVSEGVNCETVAISPYSVFAGLPVSVWGIFGYLALLILSLWSLTEKRLHSYWPVALYFLLTMLFVGVSAVLAYIAVTRIDSICLFCTATYLINLSLFGLSILAIRRSLSTFRTLFILDVMALAIRPKLTLGLAISAVFVIAILELWVPSYWKSPGWTELPKPAFGIDDEGHHWVGAVHPMMTIVEFSDYECPHCRSAHKDIRLQTASHPQKIRLVHRHFPLDTACNPQLKRPFHTRACEFAEAAECAALQGRFWEMNDALFSIQETVKTKNVDLSEIAVRLGLDRSAFKKCLNTHETRGRIAADIKDAVKLKLKGTPSFLLDGDLFVGRIPDGEILRRSAHSPREEK